MIPDPRTKLQNHRRPQLGRALRSRRRALGTYAARRYYRGCVGVHVVCGAEVHELCAASAVGGEGEEEAGAAELSAVTATAADAGG
jgi:hypothetical protein